MRAAITIDVEELIKVLVLLVRYFYFIFYTLYFCFVITWFGVPKVISIDLRSNLCGGKGVFIPEGHQAKSNSTDLKDEIRYPSLLNRVLPSGIRAIAWAPVNESFSSRFDCKQRTYHYYFPKAGLNIDVRSGATFAVLSFVQDRLFFSSFYRT